MISCWTFSAVIQAEPRIVSFFAPSASKISQCVAGVSLQDGAVGDLARRRFVREATAGGVHPDGGGVLREQAVLAAGIARVRQPVDECHLVIEAGQGGAEGLGELQAAAAGELAGTAQQAGGGGQRRAARCCRTISRLFW